MKISFPRVIHEATLQPVSCNGATLKVYDGNEWKLFQGPQKVHSIKMEGCGECFILYEHPNRGGRAVFINEPGTKNLRRPRIFRSLEQNVCPSS